MPDNFVVRLEKGVYLASWEGDPGRTLLRTNARRFPSSVAARLALSEARRYRSFPTAVVEAGSVAESRGVIPSTGIITDRSVRQER